VVFSKRVLKDATKVQLLKGKYVVVFANISSTWKKIISLKRPAVQSVFLF
jgi:hypothetical protein